MSAASRWPPGAESPEMKESEDDEGERGGGGGKAGGPVGDAKLFIKAHGAPVVECRLFKPGLAVEDGRDGATHEALIGGVDVVGAKAVGSDAGVDFVAIGGVGGEHLAGDLGVPWFVGTDEAELRSAKVGHEAEEEEVATEEEEDGELGDGAAEVAAGQLVEGGEEATAGGGGCRGGRSDVAGCVVVGSRHGLGMVRQGDERG